MAEANWYWAEGEQRNGPVAPSAIARLVADGTLGADNLIWKEGMAEWIPVSKVPALVKYLKKPPAKAAQQPPAQVSNPPVSKTPAATALVVENESPPTAIAEQPLPVESESDINQLEETANPEVGYYNPSAGLPPRAAATLQKHARPRGDVGDWPLDDLRVGQFTDALKLRKKIDAAASFYRLLLFLALIGDVGWIIGFAVTMTASRGPSAMAAGIGMGGGLAGGIGVTVLYYFAWKATVRSQIWAPLVMGSLFVLGGLAYAGMMILAVSVSVRGGPIVGVAVFVLLIAGAFAYVSFKAASAIPKYLRQPAWCQELLSKSSE